MKLNIVPARTGLTWVKLGIQTFFKQPLALAIVPAATLGLMAATQEATKGKFPMPAILVSAFRAGQQRARAMLVLGFLYAAACLLIVSIVPLFFDVPVSRESALTPEMQGVMLVVMLLYLPVSVLFWHAPALVHWHGVTPVKSLFFSLVACLRNFGAFAVFGLAWSAVFVGVGIAVTLVATGVGGPTAAGAAMFPAAMLLAAMFFTSIYFTYQASFEATEGDTA